MLIEQWAKLAGQLRLDEKIAGREETITSKIYG
jgi:hypothetical protein